MQFNHKNIINHTNQNQMIYTTFDHIYKRKLGQQKFMYLVQNSVQIH